MPEWWPLLLGWPAMFVATVLIITGLVSRRPALIYAALVLLTPISIYVLGSLN